MTEALQFDDSNPFDIDRKQLADIRKRFLSINYERLQRTRNGLNHRQRIILDLLPLMFHVNHPVIPGYVGQDAPAGVCGYKPSKPILRLAKQLSRSFRYQPLSSRKRAILGLYVMGSIGTIGQSRSSDLDVWVCYDPHLDATAVSELKNKCEHITNWAEGLGLEVCFFPMNAERFKQGETVPLSEESSGSTQHSLLLDEFYRSAIYLGGRYPLWWFVPAQHEQNYASYSQELINKRFLRPDLVIDLGALPNIPLHEYVTAAIWQMYKAIQSPYKSVLKLLLLEVYATHHPNTELLAHKFKARVHAGCEDIDQLDPYRLVYEALSEYLAANQDEKRLDVVRRCFYFKVDKALTRPSSRTPASWQRQQLQALVRHWGWDRDKLQHLDNRKQWKADTVAKEKKLLVLVLYSSYKFLTEFAREHRGESRSMHQEIGILGRQLTAAFTRQPGKIEWINPDISPNLEEPYLTFKQVPVLGNKKDQWQLFTSHPFYTLRNEVKPVKSDLQVWELVVWSYCNQLLTNETQAQLIDLNEREYPLNLVLPTLRQWLPLPKSKPNNRVFESGPQPASLLFIFNLLTPETSFEGSGSLELDPLNAGARKVSLLADAHIAVHNNWGEVHVASFTRGCFDNLVGEFLRLTPTGRVNQLPDIHFFCRQSSFSQLLKQRIEQIFQQLIDCYRGKLYPPHSRFVYMHQGHFSCWQQLDGEPQVHKADDIEQLLEHLSRPQQALGPIKFDNRTLTHHPLSAFCKLPTSAAIQVGYKIDQQIADVYISDEKGSIVYTRFSFFKEASLLRPLHQFIRSTLQRLGKNSEEDIMFGVYPVEFYRMVSSDEAPGYEAERRNITREIKDLSFFNIAITVSGQSQLPGDMEHEADGVLYRIACNDQVFDQAEWGQQVFKEAARYILGLRKNAERYPCYITDLNLEQCPPSLIENLGSDNNELQTSHYLKLKQQLEYRLNSELVAL